MTTPVDEIIEYSLEEVDGVDALFSFNKEALLASSADTPEDSFGDGLVKEVSPNASGLLDVKADWGASSVTYKAFEKITQQPKKPSKVQIIKRAAPVAEVQTITFSGAIQADESIVGVVNGIVVEVDYISDSPTTLAALDTALSLIEGVNGVTVDTLVLTLTATVEWTIPISLACEGVDNPRTVTVVKTAGRTAADDINDALLDPVLNDWYGLTAAQHDKGMNLVLAANQQALGRGFFTAKTSESGIKSSSNTTNYSTRVKSLNYRRSGHFLHQDMTEHIATAFMTYMIATEAGKFQGQHKQLVGVTPSSAAFLTTSEVGVAQSRNANTYRVIGAKAMVQPGLRDDGKPIEMTKDLDFAMAKYVERIYAWMTAPDKVEYDDPGRTELYAILVDTNSFLQAQGVARKDLSTTAEVKEFSSMDPANVTAAYYEAEASFFYARGAAKVIFKLKSIDAGAQ
jgi:hypothetical protein